MMRRLHRGQAGVAMITVVLVSTILTLLFVAAVGYAIQSQPLSRRDQDANAALAAAQAGVDDYTYRLQRNDNYRSFSAANPPTPPNPAFTGWQAVPGPASEGQFHYAAVDQTGVDGSVVLTSTGRVRNVTRTIRVTYRRPNFFDYVYFTNFETIDPEISGADPDDCDMYWYQGRDLGDCSPINFATGDVINGPLHTNDAFFVSGSPRFNGPVTTAWSGTNTRCTPRAGLNFRWRSRNGDSNGFGCSDTPVFQRSGNPQDPSVGANLDLPDSNAKLIDQTKSSLGNTGCLYTGPTRIVLNASGTMNVESQFTIPGADINCPVGNNVALPANGVIYVRNVPSGQSASCPGGGNRLGYPINRDDTSYDCRTGDVFIRGTLKGRLTVAAENRVVILNDLVYAGGTAGNDILGLIANEFVEVYHPVDGDSNLSDNRNPRPLFTDPTIHAAILAINHSFRVQNHGDGNDLGRLSITGAIAQQWRGTVGTGGATSINSGYEKNYVWDPQLAYDSPPHAFDDLDTAFQPKLYAEAKAPPPCPATPNCLPA